MKDFFYDETTEAVIRTAGNSPKTNTAFALSMPQTANTNAAFTRIVPVDLPGDRLANPQYRNWGKQVLDVILVLLALPIAVPLVLFCAIALWFEGGSPFYRQDRLGRDGQKFSILKLRTMVRNADERLESCLAADPELRREWDRTQKLKKDPRITRLGSILRKTSMDELPQIWNVLKGEMSFVGPRPMMPDQLPLYGDARCYLALRPGITGIWQVSARNEKDFSHRADADADYFHSVSLGCDLGLLVKTVGVVVRGTGY